MRRAGVRRSDGFEFGGKHITYIVGALRNRERSDRARPFWLVDALELQLEAVPQLGDLLCFNRPVRRPGRPPQWTQHSYASLRRQFWADRNQNRQPFGNSHCRLVVGFHAGPDGRRWVETIGGNEANSVRLKRVRINQSGGILNPQGDRIFGMIKLIGC